MLTLPDRPSRFYYTVSGTSGKNLELAFEGRAKVYITTPEEGFVLDRNVRQPDFESGGAGAFFPINLNGSRDRILITVLTQDVADSGGQWMRMVVAQNLRKIDLRIRMVGTAIDYPNPDETTAKLTELVGRCSARLFRLSGGTLRIGKVEYVVGLLPRRGFKDNVTFEPQQVGSGPEAVANPVSHHVHMTMTSWDNDPFYSSQVLAHELLHSEMQMPDEYREGAPTCTLAGGPQRGESDEICPHSIMANSFSVRLCTPSDHNPNHLNFINGEPSMWEILHDQIGAPVPADSASPILFWNENRPDDSVLRSLDNIPTPAVRR
jgi:hypothetical protein